MAGFVVATVLILALVVFVVIKAPLVQGQLYYEDGPAAFFFILFIFWLIASSVAAMMGMLAVALFDVLLKLLGVN